MNRRIIASLLVIGVVGATAAGTTFALFSDSEDSQQNTFAAGEIDLKIDWNESYNGEPVETQELTDNPGPIFNLTDVKPGDEGKATVSLHVGSNPAYVHFNATQTANLENGCTEPEAEVDQSCGNPGQGEGELGQFQQFTIWYDDGDNVRQDDEEIIFEGTAEELDGSTVELDGDPSTEQIDPVQPDEVSYVGVKWEVPREVGNVIQGDTKRFDFDFFAVQARHNSDREKPGNETPNPGGGDNGDMTPTPGEENETVYWQTDLVHGDVIETLGPGNLYGTNNRLRTATHGLYNGTTGQHEFESNPDPNAGNNGVINCIDDVEPVEIVGNDEARITFDVTEDDCEDITFVSYAKDHPGFDINQAVEQLVVDDETVSLDEGHDQSITIDLPEELPPGYVSVN